jgi:hypothetical protein
VAEETFSLQLDLGLGEGADAEELDEATAALLRELRELEVDSAERVAGGPAPEGARAIEVALLGSLVIKLGQAAVGPIARVLQDWLARRSGRTIKLTLGEDSIELSGGSAAFQREMIETFLRARAER